MSMENLNNVTLHPLMRKRLFEMGQEHFNEERFFEAHEAWEDLWHHETGRDREFIQGLIQTAGHFVHLQRGNWSGAIRLAESAKKKFIMPPADKAYNELDMIPILSALNYNAVETTRQPGFKQLSENGAADPTTLSTEVLPLDPFLVPKLF